ncbi:MAG: hypothetical protein QM723_17515 [Myxococcaceae bacterium]
MRWWLASLVLMGCGPGREAGETPFIAEVADFVGYRSWNSWSFAATAGGTSTHTSSPRTVYLNRRPPEGSKAFPVGTIIVKDLDWMTQTFAMVKRGAGYNDGGAKGWEWVELVPGADPPRIVWRGIAPPPHETYAGTESDTCNACHSGASGNDYVQSQALSLAGF